MMMMSMMINDVDDPFSGGERTTDNAKLGIVTIKLICFNEEKVQYKGFSSSLE